MENVGKMCETLACHIFCKVLSAVDFMHSQGIIHRDIKGLLCLLHSSDLHNFRSRLFGDMQCRKGRFLLWVW